MYFVMFMLGINCTVNKNVYVGEITVSRLIDGKI